MKNENKQQLYEILNECARVCNHCAVACLSEREVSMLTKCIRLDLECAEICRTAAVFIERDAVHTDELLSVCAVVCNSCADECDKHSHMDHCRECADVCRQCAEACQQLEHI